MRFRLLKIILTSFCGLPLVAGSMVSVTCSIPNDTITQSGANSASCSLSDSLFNAADASGSAGQGSLSLTVAAGGITPGPYASAVGSFDEVFAYPTTLTWMLGLGCSYCPVQQYNVSLQLGPVALTGPEIYAITKQFP